MADSFAGVVLAGHKQAAIEVPFDPAQRWGVAAATIFPGRRGHAVQARVGGEVFRSYIVPRSKRFWLILENPQLKAMNVEVGDRIRVSLEPWRGR